MMITDDLAVRVLAEHHRKSPTSEACNGCYGYNTGPCEKRQLAEEVVRLRKELGEALTAIEHEEAVPLARADQRERDAKIAERFVGCAEVARLIRKGEG